MNTRLRKLTWLLVLAFLLSGCQSSPEKSSVISKRDGSFDISVIQSATMPESGKEATTPSSESEPTIIGQDNETTPAKTLSHSSQFSSTDGTVVFNMGIDMTATEKAMPVVEVTPHFLTSEDVKRVANVLFGDLTFYEAEPLGQEVYSVSEIQEKLDRLLNYKGNTLGDPETFNMVRENFIKAYTLKMESAPKESQHVPCQWEFRKESYYFNSLEEYAKMDTSHDNDQIQARVKVNGVPYLLDASTRNRKDFKLNNIYVQIDDGPSPLAADYYIFQNMLCTTEKPNEADIAAISDLASKMLQQMNLGEWEIDECYVEVANHNAEPEYIIVVKAVPVFEQVAGLRRAQLQNLKSKESYASNYYLTDAQFKFNMSGTLLEFTMFSPIDIKSVVNSNVQLLSMDELFQRAEGHLALSDYYQYDYMGYLLDSPENWLCMVNISDAELGMTRVKVPNSDESYYYVPAISFTGAIQYQEKDTGTVYDVETEGDKQVLLILNAVDGSVINMTNE